MPLCFDGHHRLQAGIQADHGDERGESEVLQQLRSRPCGITPYIGCLPRIQPNSRPASRQPPPEPSVSGMPPTLTTISPDQQAEHETHAHVDEVGLDGVRQFVTRGVDGALRVFRRSVERDDVAVFELCLGRKRQRLTGARNALDVHAVAHVAVHDLACRGDCRCGSMPLAREHAFARLHDDAHVADVGDLARRSRRRIRRRLRDGPRPARDVVGFEDQIGRRVERSDRRA